MILAADILRSETRSRYISAWMISFLQGMRICAFLEVNSDYVLHSITLLGNISSFRASEYLLLVT